MIRKELSPNLIKKVQIKETLLILHKVNQKLPFLEELQISGLLLLLQQEKIQILKEEQMLHNQFTIEQHLVLMEQNQYLDYLQELGNMNQLGDIQMDHQAGMVYQIQSGYKLKIYLQQLLPQELLKILSKGQQMQY